MSRRRCLVCEPRNSVDGVSMVQEDQGNRFICSSLPNDVVGLPKSNLFALTRANNLGRSQAHEGSSKDGDEAHFGCVFWYYADNKE